VLCGVYPLWRWQHVGLSTGATVTGRFLVSAAGGLSQPSIPDLLGLPSFRGKVFHSARWCVLQAERARGLPRSKGWD
jgi:cation diffusion facilitator CzcD-associated flavoprotein CzcO